MPLIVEFTYAPTDPMKNANLEAADAATDVLDPSDTAQDDSAEAPEGTNCVDLYADTDGFWFQIAYDPDVSQAGSDCRFIASGERRQFECAAGKKVGALLAS